MRAITLYQPWASLVACGAKTIETRSWPTSYRGPLAIHAGQASPKWVKDALSTDKALSDALCDVRPKIIQAGHLSSEGIPPWNYSERLPRGVIVATCNLINCRSTESGSLSWLYELEGTPEMLYGDYTPGRYAWILTDIKPLPEPIPARGMQGLWTPDAEMVERIERQVTP